MNGGESWKHNADRILESMSCIVGRKLRNGAEMPLSKKDRESLTAVDIRNRETLQCFPVVAPWMTEKAGCVVFNTGMECTKSDPDPVKKKATEDTLKMLGTFDVEIWTDGSVVDKKGAGAARIFVTKSKTSYDAVAPSGFLSSSFRSESVALYVGLVKMMGLKTLRLVGKSVLICSDSKSMITALAKGPLSQGGQLLSKVWGLLIELVECREVSKVIIQFVYSHCGVERNEIADKLAEEALRKFKSVDQRKGSIPLQAVKAMVKLECKNRWISNLDSTRPRYQVCKGAYTDLKRSGTLSRKDEVTLAQLRAGESMMMGKLRNRLGIGSPLCRWCKVEDETVVHVYTSCRNRGLEQLRRQYDVKDVQILHTKPEVGLSFCGEALRLLR